MSYEAYDELRTDTAHLFGYGLFRRLQKVQASVLDLATGSGFERIVDFGCADGAMLKALAANPQLGIQEAIGFDLFEKGVPDASPTVRFVRSNLFHDYPYALEENSVDLCIASAFYKHNPDPQRFLLEVSRVLKDGGLFLLLDPCSTVVLVGLALNYFDRNWMPNRWDLGTLRGQLAETGLTNKLEILSSERYWLAPNMKTYELGLERLIPGPLRRAVGLHQIVVLRHAGG